MTAGAPVTLAPVDEVGVGVADSVGVAGERLRVAVSNGDDPLTKTAAAGLGVGGTGVGVVSEVVVIVTMTGVGVTVTCVGVT